MSYPWGDVQPNQRYPACAQVARRLLAEACGCKPGDKIPPEDELLARARETAGRTPWDAAADKASVALQMVQEIGGLTAPPAP